MILRFLPLSISLLSLSYTYFDTAYFYILSKCIEAATVGLPFEVWKTHMGTYRSETTMQAFRNIYKSGGVVSIVHILIVLFKSTSFLNIYIIVGGILGRMAAENGRKFPQRRNFIVREGRHHSHHQDGRLG